ncbi:TPA: hypothetical protein PBG70_001171 [Staphylococcus aureus]|nr:hypothetical protein [Staphylococcus aureus]
MFELKVGIIKREANDIISNSTGGKEMQGILHLIFCWTGIPHILAIISAVITVFKPADEQGNVTL